ncbi:GBF-interacting protein 1 [Hibiscus syriacus]|uniref:GBF-interacting protein 1 n=1 Tax=Hibiscus syriacus TaxID=106335 RepID=A0A6A2YLB4_HIBSY|nr:GBF-interacting protein 1 [Hibiscus syriacus]
MKKSMQSSKIVLWIPMKLPKSLFTWTSGTQERRGQGSRRSYYSSSGKDVGGGRNSFPRRENGVNHSADGGYMPSQVSQKVKNNASSHMKKTSTAIPNGTPTLPNGNSSHGRGPRSSIGVVASEVTTVAGKVSYQLLASSNFCNGQHVTFPTHFQVSEALKNCLTFGSFDASFGQVLKPSNVTNLEINSARPVETSQGVDGAAGEPASWGRRVVQCLIPGFDVNKDLSNLVLLRCAAGCCILMPDNESTVGYFRNITLGQPRYLPAVDGDNTHQQEAPLEFEKVPESDCSILSDTDLKVDQSNQEMHMHSESNHSIIPNVPSYGLSFMPASAAHLAQFDGPDARNHDVSRLRNLVCGNSPAPSGNSASPIQSSVAAAPQAVHLFRQPFPPNHFPSPHYLSPFYMHPMHQFLSPTGLPQQPSTGNVYMPPGATPPEVKFPLPQFKPGTLAGNPAHLAIPSGYGPLTSPPIGFSLPVPSVTSASSSSKEDIAALQLKENHIYTTGPLNEGSALWMPAPGQDLSNLQVNSLYNLSLHGQQLPYSPNKLVMLLFLDFIRRLHKQWQLLPTLTPYYNSLNLWLMLSEL